MLIVKRNGRAKNCLALLTVSLFASLAAPAVHAQSCPFDDGHSSLAVEGLILTRYALGLTGAPLVANTGIAAASATTVEDAVNSPAYGLNITGNATMTPVDAAIISRRLAGISDSALTSGLALGSGARNTPAAVQSFLLAGCPGTAWVQGGNAFAVPGVIGTTDAQPLKVVSGGPQVSLEIPGGNGLRVVQTTGPYADAPNVINGSVGNTASAQGATVAGGGTNYSAASCGRSPLFDPEPCINVASWYFATVGGGRFNTASGYGATVGGGDGNTASGYASVVPGGWTNTASGMGSFAAGLGANAVHDGAFTWSDGGYYLSKGNNSFNVQASQGFYLSDFTSQYFGSTTRQMLNLWGGDGYGTAAPYGIGVQASTQYFRSAGSFSWHRGGSHSDAANNAGVGGVEIMRLTNASLLVNGTFVQGSDRAIKENFARVNAKQMLASVVALPLSLWNYRQDADKTQHLGPMAQDFKRLFKVGQDDKTIATVDASGVAFAAIQGLHQVVKEKDGEIAALKARLKAIEQRLGIK